MTPKKPQLSLTDQLIAAEQQVIDGADAELATLREECAQRLRDAAKLASDNLIKRGNAVHDGGKLITVLDSMVVTQLVPVDVTGAARAAVGTIDGERVAGFSLDDHLSSFLVPSECAIAYEAFASPGMYVLVDAYTIVEDLVTLETFKDTKCELGPFFDLLAELELYANRNLK